MYIWCWFLINCLFFFCCCLRFVKIIKLPNQENHHNNSCYCCSVLFVLRFCLSIVIYVRWMPFRPSSCSADCHWPHFAAGAVSSPVDIGAAAPPPAELPPCCSSCSNSSPIRRRSCSSCCYCWRLTEKEWKEHYISMESAIIAWKLLEIHRLTESHFW